MNKRWITPPAPGLDEARRPTWWLRRCFSLDSVPESLVAEIVCLGYYELYVNGEKIGAEPLAPSISKLDKRAFAIGHDLGGHLHAGKNCLAIWCSSGWYLPHQFKVHDHATPLLRIAFATDVTFEGEWLCRASNRWITDAWAWNRFGGEEVDARLNVPDWNLATGDLDGWHPVREVSAPPLEISGRTCPPNRIGEVYPARSVRPLPDGRFEVDFGICLSGWVDVMFPDVQPGQTITLRFHDLPADSQRNKDQSYNQVSIYHADGGGNDRFVNKFNYAGFRYMTLDGLRSPPAIADMRALLIESAMDRAGHFRCSSALYNRIHNMNLQTLRCLNLGGYSVDCPHRERNGYGADGQTALPGYLYLLDAKTFLRKWLQDWCDVYEPDTGRIMLTAPTHHAQHAPAWGGIVAPLAWALYVYYDDREAMEYAFPVIEGHLRFLQRGVRDGVLRKDLLGSAFHADWVPPGRGMDSQHAPDLPMRELFNSCYLIHLWQIYLRICDVLRRNDRRDEAEANLAALREGVHREFYDDARGLYLLPEQVYQAMPLLTGVVPEVLRESVARKLIALIAEKGWHMDTGLPGTTLLLDWLMQAGEHDVIARIYAQETYPGWGYMLANGATTIWEQWNGFWSQIHSCFAGPAAWFYAGLAGIRPDQSGPGFKRFVLAPAFLREIDFVECAYYSASGRIESSWRRNGDTVHWHAEIPAGCQASVHIPSDAPSRFTVNGEDYCEKAGTIEEIPGGIRRTFPLGQGAYDIVCRLSQIRN